MLMSHKEDTRFDLEHTINLIKTNTSDHALAVEKLELLKALSEFPLGRFLLTNRGLNGYWTAYVILHGMQSPSSSPLESWLLNDAPGIKATKERFYIFQHEIQKRLKDNMVVASVPCGLMDDLFIPDYNNLSNISLVGIDLDSRSLTLAKENANNYGIDFVEFLEKDAWHLEITNQFDMLVSNGLNIYESNPKRLINLYQQYNQAIKLGGTLITSFLTPPPIISPESPWKNVNMEDVKKQQLIFGELIQANWQFYQLEKDVREQLNKAGFIVDNIIEDNQGMFPTVIARKDSTC